MDSGVRRAQRRDKAEVDHDEDFTEAHVAVGLRATGVEPPGDDGRKTNHDEPPRAASSEG